MNRNLLGRLNSLEDSHDTNSGRLHLEFWEAIPLEQVAPKTCQLIESLYKDGCDPPDPIEALIVK